MSKFIVLNTKGGVGKSTTAMQVLAPYLYKKNDEKEKINLIEFDDENKDSEKFVYSEIVNSKRYLVEGSDLDSNIIDISLGYKNLIIDVGGNKTTTYVLNSFKKSRMLKVFDCVVIPLTDGEQDSLNAINVYRKIRESNKDIKIIFALSRVNRKYELEIQFLDFFGDRKGRIDDRKGFIEKIDERDRNIIEIDDTEAIRISRAYSLTAYELAKQSIEDLENKMEQFLKDDNMSKARKAGFRIIQIENAVNFKKEVLERCFNKIDEVLG